MQEKRKDWQVILEMLSFDKPICENEIGRKYWKNWDKQTHYSQLGRIFERLEATGLATKVCKGKWVRNKNPSEVRLKRATVASVQELSPVNYVSIFHNDLPIFLFGTTSWEKIDRVELEYIHARKDIPKEIATYRVNIYNRLFRETCDRFVYELEEIIDKINGEHKERVRELILLVLAQFLWGSSLFQRKYHEDEIKRFGLPENRDVRRIWTEYVSLNNLQELLDFTGRTEWVTDCFQFYEFLKQNSDFKDFKVEMPTYMWNLFDAALLRLGFSSNKSFKTEEIKEGIDKTVAFLSKCDNFILLKEFMERTSKVKFMLLVSVGINAIDERPDLLIERFESWMEELAVGEHDTDDFLFEQGFSNVKEFLKLLKNRRDKPHETPEKYIKGYLNTPWGTSIMGEHDYTNFRSRLAVDDIESWDLRYLYEKHPDGKKQMLYRKILNGINERLAERRRSLQWEAVQKYKGHAQEKEKHESL